MATNITLDEALMTDALSFGKHQSKRAVIEEALREYVAKRKQQEVIALFGQIDYDPAYDYKAARNKK